MSSAKWSSVFDPEVAKRLARRMAATPHIVPTGLPSIDKRLWYWGDRRGIPRGEYVIVAGGVNSGKTVTGLYLAKQAVAAGEKAAIFSLEMREDSLAIRLYQGKTDIKNSEWIPSRWSKSHAQRLMEGVQRWSNESDGDLLINDSFRGDLLAVLAEIQHLIDQGVTFILLDHLQLVRVEGFGPTEVAARAEVAGEAFRQIAFEQGVTLCCLSQLTSGAARDYSTTPTFHDVYGGVPVTSHASLVVVCDHSRYSVDPEREHIARTWINHSKSRLGPKNIDVPVLWDYSRLEMREALDDEVREWPQHER